MTVTRDSDLDARAGPGPLGPAAGTDANLAAALSASLSGKLSELNWGFPSHFIKSTKVLMATPGTVTRRRRLGYHDHKPDSEKSRTRQEQ